MKSRLFESLSSSKIAKLISEANQRVVLAAPSLHEAITDAMVQAVERLGHENVTVIIDCDEEVFRLGYGEIKAVTRLHETGRDLRQSPGLRIGILVCDSSAGAFAPLPFPTYRQI